MELVDRVHAILGADPNRIQILFVDDASTDRSWSVIQQLAVRHPTVGGMALARNSGQQNATLAGVVRARHDVIVTIDDDLQHPPEEIPTLLAALAPHIDVVYGTPQRTRQPLGRRLASAIVRRVLRAALGVEIAGSLGSFRAFRARLRSAFGHYRSPFVSVDALLTWGTTRFSAVPVRHEPRRHGRSNYDIGALLLHALDLTTGFSILPLRAASFIGFGLTVVGIVLLAYVLIRFLIEGGSVPGFPFLASVMVVFSGAQLFVLGLIGEYLGRMYFRMMDRPGYIVGAECGWLRLPDD